MQDITYMAFSITKKNPEGDAPGPSSILGCFATSGKAFRVLHIFLSLLTYCRREISLIPLTSTWQLCRYQRRISCNPFLFAVGEESTNEKARKDTRRKLPTRASWIPKRILNDKPYPRRKPTEGEVQRI